MTDGVPTRPEQTEFKYWAFISYSHRDKAWGDWLHCAIETFKVPAHIVGREGRDGRVPKRLFPVFRDRDELPTSGNLGENIEQALRDSRYLVVICSPAAAASRWVEQEIRTFKALGREDKILCLIVDGEPNASDKTGSAPECFPEALRHKAPSYAGLSSNRAEPIAADAREGQDGKGDARLKVLAGLLGVGFDDLRQRDLERRRRQRVWMVAGGFAIFAALTGIWGWQERSKRRETTRELALAYISRAQQMTEKGDDPAAAAFYAKSNLLHESHLARANCLSILMQLPQPRIMIGSTEAVDAVAFSPDGAVVLTGSRDKTARLWDAQTGAPLGKTILHENQVRAVVFNPDGKSFLTVSQGVAQIRSVQAGEPLGKAMSDYGFSIGPVFSPEGRSVITLDSTPFNSFARLWDAATGERKGSALRHVSNVARGPEAVTAFAFAPDGKRVLTAGKDMTARLWDAETGESLEIVMRHEQAVQDAAFHPGGKTILTASGRTAQLWDAQTGKALGRAMVHDDDVRAADFSPDGKRVLTDSGGTARLWDAETCDSLGVVMRHGGAISKAAFSPDGSSILTIQGKHARLWDARDGAPIGMPMWHEGSVSGAIISPDGRGVLTASEDKTARLWDVGAIMGPPPGPVIRNEDGGTAFAVSPDGARILTVSPGKPAKLWDGATGEPIGVSMGDGAEFVHALAFSPNGKSIALGTADGAQIWDVATGKREGRPFHPADTIEAISFSPDGRSVLTRSGKVAQLWNWRTGEPIGNVMRHEDRLRATTFSPDGKSILTGGADKVARLWAAETGIQLGKAMPHEDEVSVVAFSPDGRSVLTGSHDKTARLWDSRTGATMGKVLRHEGFVRAVAFSPDGKIVLTGSYDGSARLWDPKTGESVGKVMRQALVDVASFSPDGKSILTGSIDGSAQLWDAATGEPIGKPIGKPTRTEDRLVALSFSPDGKSIYLGSRRAARLLGTAWLVRPLVPRQLLLWSQVLSHLRINARGDVEAIPLEDWRMLKELWESERQ